MADKAASVEERLACLEEMVALLFASEHLLSADPKEALLRLKAVLSARSDDAENGSDISETADAVIARIEELQRILPRKLVD